MTDAGGGTSAPCTHSIPSSTMDARCSLVCLRLPSPTAAPGPSGDPVFLSQAPPDPDLRGSTTGASSASIICLSAAASSCLTAASSSALLTTTWCPTLRRTRMLLKPWLPTVPRVVWDASEACVPDPWRPGLPGLTRSKESSLLAFRVELSRLGAASGCFDSAFSDCAV